MSCSNCKALRENVRELRMQLGLDADRHLVMTLNQRLGIKNMEAMILAALYTSKRALSAEHLVTLTNCAGVGAIATHVSRIRAAIGRDAILPRKPRSYMITGQGRQAVETAMHAQRIAMEALMNTETVNIPTAMAVLAGRLAHERGAPAAMEALARISQQLEAHGGS